MQDQVLGMIKEYRERHNLPPDIDDSKKLMIERGVPTYHKWQTLRRMEKHPFLTVQDLLERAGEFYLSHNGSIYVGFALEDFAQLLGFKIPERVPEIFEGDGSPRRVFRPRENGWESIGVDNSYGNPDARIDDIEIKHPEFWRGLEGRFLEELFQMPQYSLKSSVIQANYGIRIDKRGPLRNVYEVALARNIPLLICRAETEMEINPFYVANLPHLS